MFDRFEHLLARHDLAQNLSREGRKVVFVLLCVIGFWLFSAYVSTYLAVLALIVLPIVGKLLPKKTPANGTSTPAPEVVPDVKQRPAPELVAGFDAYMRPTRDLLRGIAQDQRQSTMVALLDVMEVFTELGQYLCIDRDDILRAVLAGDLPRMTKGADDLLANGATLYLNHLAVNEHGRSMVVRLSLVDGPDITFHWNVRMLGGTCVYRIDQTQTVGR